MLMEKRWRCELVYFIIIRGPLGSGKTTIAYELAIKLGINDFKIYGEYFANKNNFKEDSRSIAKHLMMISKFTFVLAELRIEMEY